MNIFNNSKAQVHPTAIIDKGAEIGAGTKVWHYCHIMGDAVIGKNVTLGHNVFIGQGVIIGDGVKIQNNVSVFSGVEIRENVFIGPHVCFTNVINPRAFIERKNEFRSTLVQRGASIGANATVICGLHIGEYAMVGAGSVVTYDVKDFCLVYGNPAKPRGWISMCGKMLQFSGIRATCESCFGVYTFSIDRQIVTRMQMK